MTDQILQLTKNDSPEILALSYSREVLMDSVKITYSGFADKEIIIEPLFTTTRITVSFRKAINFTYSKDVYEISPAFVMDRADHL